MNIGLFGGTFDPIHRGHLALARAAKDQFKLGRIYFVPASAPPHRPTLPAASYLHRYVMVALATAGEKDFVPSLLEAPGSKSDQSPDYSIDTIRRLKSTLKKNDRLFFLMGIDAFKEIAKWREAEALFRECAFVVASRPGYSLADIANALPKALRPAAAATRPFHKQPAKGDLMLSGVTLHLLDSVHRPISATAIRQAASSGKPLGRFVDDRVAEYIRKMALYKNKA
jgi:nicotinate-nucleotide adenylyltransferase